MRLGAHVPGGDPLAEAAARNAEVVQIFLSNPQSWKKPLPRSDAADLRTGSLPIYVHAPYLVNLVAENNRVRIPSRKILQETCDAAAEIGAAGVVVHGGHVTGADDAGEAPMRWRKALDQLSTHVPVLIENTASGDFAAVRRWDGLAALWDAIGGYDVGFVLDTCHAWAGGEALEGIVERTLAITGRIDLVHCNDSRDGFDSRRDRHANLGDGEIPLDSIVAVVREAGAVTVVETPGGSSEQAEDIELIRSEL